MGVGVGRTSRRGFTLIELMIVVAVLGVLAVLAYPSFTQQLRKSDRTEGRGALQELVLAQEHHRRGKSGYTTNVGELKVSLKASESESGVYLTSGGLYKISVPSADRGGFVAVAAAAGRQLQDKSTNCHAIAVQVTLTGMRRGHLDATDSFVESDECW